MDFIYTSDSSDSDSRDENTLDFSHFFLNNETVEENLLLVSIKSILNINTIKLNHNILSSMPVSITKYLNLRVLDVSSNGLTELPNVLMHCPLTRLIARNNCLTNKSLPKSLLSPNSKIKEINLSGNRLTNFPEQVIELKTLKYLYLGGNVITNISKDIWKLDNLNVLSIGANVLTDVPESVGQLKQLQALILSDNLIESLPRSISKLSNLKTLSLHKNKLRTLPTEIIGLKCLVELSLRDNPLVVQFVKDMTLDPPSLRELSARAIKLVGIQCGPGDLPQTLREYLASGNCCVNPKCQGVFFDNRVEHIKFVDFCGKYRVPLLQYLCSAQCISEIPRSRSECAFSEEYEPRASPDLMRKVLLG